MSKINLRAYAKQLLEGRKHRNSLGGNNMTKEQLDALLAEGKITQEEYNAKLKELEGSNEPLKADEIKKMIELEAQRAADRVRTEYNQKLKDKEQELETLKASKMTDEERKADELQKAQTELERVQAELKQASNERHTTNALANASLPLEASQFIKGDDENAINESTKALKEFVEAQVQKAVEEAFKTNGYTPPGSQGQVSANPWKKESLNLTEQGRILKENPTLAKQLMAQANK